MIAERIKQLRTSCHMTQTSLAKKLNITRSSVNAWEMGLSIPSTTYIVELSQLFQVSTDYLLGLKTNIFLDASSLSEQEIHIVYELIQYFKEMNSKKQS
ncbi:helix-turn-helix domain-containing protein [Dorea sp. D27]|uniref:helix-turn-helix domain-containing protein n=1 Tax=Dorea sp. D27 TaxID=658665 RepID=UPI0006733C54|nr:helix-turn-helix transcriptional regulator [Dorea sp. D27]